jgi:hypothetical protein
VFVQEHGLLPTNANEARAGAQIGVQECIDALRIISQTWECAESLAVQLEARVQSQRCA